MLTCDLCVDLKVLLPEAKWNNYHLRLIYFGREHCPAQRHDPAMCPICSWAAVPPYNKYATDLCDRGLLTILQCLDPCTHSIR